MTEEIRGGAALTAICLKTVVVAGALSVIATLAAADDAAVPRHLQIARDFVANTKPENNSYTNKNPYTRMPGDFLASEYVVATDCSRFVVGCCRFEGHLVKVEVQTGEGG